MDADHPDLPYGAKVIDGNLMVPNPPLSPGITHLGRNDSGDLWSDGASRTWVPFQKPVPFHVDVYDTNNYLRKIFEKASNNPLRQVFSDAYYSPHPCIYVFDGANAKAARREIFPGYKVGRPKAPDGFYHTLEFFQELLSHTGAVVIKVPGHEADDVIGHLADTTKVPLVIHSTDADYLAKCGPLVTAPLSQAGSLGHLSPQDVRLYKTLVGDSSDKIPGWRLFGKKAWAQLSEKGKEHLTAFLSDETLQLDTFHLESDLCRHSHLDWLRENACLVRSYWRVVGFLPMTPEIINPHMVVGKRDYALADQKLKGSFL